MEKIPNTSFDLDKLAIAAQEHLADRGAAQKFFKQIYPFVRRVCARTVARRPSRHRAFEDEDLVQEVCAKVWKSLPKFKLDKGHFAGWVWTLASRAWIDLAFSRDDTPEVVQLDDELPHEISAVDVQVDARRSLALLKGALPPLTFKLIVLQGAGHSAQDIADMQGANVETVKTRIRVARQRAFDHLNDYAIVPFSYAVA